MFKRRKPDEGYDAYAFSSFAGVAAAAAAAADAVTLSLSGQGSGGQGSGGGHGSNGAGNGAARHTDLPAGPGDSGIGVPPFRSAPSKESPTMARTPFSVAPATPSALPATAIQPPSAQPAQRSPVQLPHPPAPDVAERRTLVVGRGISVQGTVQDAERLVVEGTVEASMIRAAELSISPGGVFKGEVEVEDAEIAGTIDGTLTARNSLVVRASGRVLGTAHCKRLQVEDGGQITGRIQMLTDGAPPAPSSASSRPATTEPAL